MQRFQSIKDIVRVANQVVVGELEPCVGCCLIADIAAILDCPDGMVEFIFLTDEAVGRDFLTLTRETCNLPDIISACRRFITLWWRGKYKNSP